MFDWEYEVESLHDAGDRVVTIVSQRGPGLDAARRKIVRVENYADPDEALRAAGLSGEDGRPAV